MSLSFWQIRSKLPEIHFDMAVVGGGIIGSATAYWISKLLPDARIALIDAGPLAGGASGRNAGFLLQGALSDYLRDCDAYGAERARRLWRFTRENREMIASEMDGSRFDLDVTGSIVAAGSQQENERLRACVGPMRSDGAAVAYLAAEEANRRMASRGFFGALVVPTGATVDPLRLVREIAAASRASVLEHHRVEAIDGTSAAVVLETESRRIIAERVVVAINAWLPQLLPELSQYVRPVRAQMLATTRLPKRWLDVPVYTHNGYFYLRQTRNGELLAGGARHLHKKEEVGYADETTKGVQGSIEAYLKTHFPRFAGAAVRHRWSGTMGFSPDHLPIVGEIPNLPGSYWAGGFSGHGMGYGFRFGRMMAELVRGTAAPEGLSLFSITRFDTLQKKVAS